MVSGGGLNVLVVEDERNTAAALSLLFRQRFDALPMVAEDCETARDLFSSQRFDIITLDYQLPDGTGLDLLEEIGAMEDPPPVIMITGHGDEWTAVEAFRLGASGYVVKDKRMSTMLMDAIGHALSTVELTRLENELHDIDRQYRLMFRNMDEGVAFYSVLKDEEGSPVDLKIVEVNDRFLEILGLRKSEVVGRSYTELFGSGSPTMLDLYMKVMHDGSFGVDEIYHESVGRYLRMSAFSPEEDSLFVLFSDITEHKRRQEALAQSEIRLREMYETAGEGIVIVGYDRVLLDSNPKAAELFGFGDVEEMIGQEMDDIVSLEDRDRVSALLGADGRVEGFECALHKRDGSIFWVKINAVVNYDEHGEPRTITSFIEDVTGRRMMWEALKESEAVLSDIYNVAAEGIVVVDTEDKVLFANPKALSMFGFETAAEVVGAELPDFLLGPEFTMELKNRLISDGFLENFDVELHRKDGTLFWGRLNVVMRGDVQGTQGKATAFISDITEEKEAFMALAESEARLRELYDSAPEAITLTGPDNRFTYANHKAAEVFGYDNPEEMIGVAASEFYHDPAVRKEIYDQLWEKGSVEGFEGLALRKDGTVFWARLNAVLTKDTEGNWVRTHFLLNDISEFKDTERALMRSNEELAAYAHSVSHDLKGPLSAVSVMADLLEEELGGREDNRTEEMLFLLKKNVHIAQERVDALLRLAASGQVPTEVEEVDLNEVVDRVLTLYSLSIREKGIRVKVENDLGFIRANGQQIRQVFANLINNAIKHNDSDSPEITISRLADEGATMRFMVRDNGSGFAEEAFEHLFTPFRSTGLTGETGLGLSIARKISHIYGGEIRAFNDNGACLEVSLNNLG